MSCDEPIGDAPARVAAFDGDRAVAARFDEPAEQRVSQAQESFVSVHWLADAEQFDGIVDEADQRIQAGWVVGVGFNCVLL